MKWKKSVHRIMYERAFRTSLKLTLFINISGRATGSVKPVHEVQKDLGLFRRPTTLKSRSLETHSFDGILNRCLSCLRSNSERCDKQRRHPCGQIYHHDSCEQKGGFCSQLFTSSSGITRSCIFRSLRFPRAFRSKLRPRQRCKFSS